MTDKEKINLLTDDVVLTTLGEKIRRVRLARDITQIALAEESGVAKRTIERFEKGASIQLTSLIRVLRALEMLELLMNMIPDQQNSPMAQLLGEKKTRYRASGKKQGKDESATQTNPKWQWGEE